MRLEGTIRSWNDERGFGFIAPAQGGQEIFFHVKAFSGRDSQWVKFVNQPQAEGSE